MSRYPVMNEWLSAQQRAAADISDRSDIVTVKPYMGVPASAYIAEFDCRGLVQTDGGIEVCDRHVVGIRFPNDYLRRSSRPGEIVTLLEPSNSWHPNALGFLLCLGHIPVGMSLVDLICQIYSVLTWQRYTPVESDALNRDACSWARRNTARLPVEPRRSLWSRRSVAQ